MMKREELRATIRAAQRDLRFVEGALGVLGVERTGPQEFGRGELMALVCDAWRAGFDGNVAVAREICRIKGWEADDERMRSLRLKVKDVAKRIRRREREDAVRLSDPFA